MLTLTHRRARVLQEEELILVLVKLVEFLGHRNQIVSATAVNEVRTMLPGQPGFSPNFTGFEPCKFALPNSPAPIPAILEELGVFRGQGHGIQTTNHHGGR